MMEEPPVAMGIYLTVLLVAGLGAFFHCLSRRLFRLRRTPVPAWRIRPVDFGVFVSTLVLVLIAVQITFALLVPEPEQANGLPPHLMLIGGALSQITFIAVWGFFRINTPQTFREPMSGARITWGRAAVYALYAFLAFIPLFAAINVLWGLALDSLAPETLRTQEMVEVLLEAHSGPLLFGMFLLLVILAPVAEELVFRGCLYRFLKGIVPVYAAMGISSALFGAIHLHLAGLPVLIAFGALLCFAYERTGNLKVPILLHAFFNLNTFVLTVIQVRAE